MSAPLDTLWYTRCPVPTGLGIAIQKGWLEDTFRAQGTKLGSLLESNDFATRESHFSHTVQNSVRHGGNIPAISARWTRCAPAELPARAGATRACSACPGPMKPN